MGYRNTGSSAGGLKSLRSFVLHSSQALNDALSGLRRQTTVRQSSGVFVEVGRGLVEKLELLEIALAPRAYQVMQPHLEPHAQRERPFQ